MQGSSGGLYTSPMWAGPMWYEGRRRIRVPYKRWSKFWLLSLITAALVSDARAQLAPRKADEWVNTLEGPQRVATQKIDQVLSKLNLQPGMIVADIGAGSGLFSRPLAKAV